MDDYKPGFLEGLNAAILLVDAKWKHHFENTKSKSLSEDDQVIALTCVVILGGLSCDIQRLGVNVHRGLMEFEKIIQANGEPYWWATPNGKGKTH